MLPAAGSTITQAIAPGCASNRACTLARSLNCAISVCLARSSGTPAELGCPNASAPLPALTSRLSAVPW